MTRRNDFFNMTQRIELFVRFKELNLFFELWLADVNFFSMTHRNVTQKLNFFLFDCDSKILTFFLMTQRIEPSFLIWLKKRTFFDMPTRIEPFSQKKSLQELNFVKNMTQRIERFFLFWRNLTQRLFFFKL